VGVAALRAIEAAIRSGRITRRNAEVAATRVLALR
jgi:hypothetical protein